MYMSVVTNKLCFLLLGILTLQPTSQAKTKAAGLTRHQLAMMALGVPAIFLGTLAIVRRKALHESPHFTTWHGVSHHSRCISTRHGPPTGGSTASMPLHFDVAMLPVSPKADVALLLDTRDYCCGVVGDTGHRGGRERLVLRTSVWRQSEGQVGLEVPQVCRARGRLLTQAVSFNSNARCCAI